MTRKETGLDLIKLQSMTDPLNVRVVLKRNGIVVPVPLPSKSDESNYPTVVSDYTRDDIVELEQFLLNKWTGGGFYKVDITDSKGDLLKWEFGYPTSLYPERIPPPMMGAASQGTAPAQATSSAQANGQTTVVIPQSSNSGWLNRQASGFSPMYPIGQGQNMAPLPLASVPSLPVNASPDDRMRRLEQQLEEERRLRMKDEFDRQLERERQRHEQEIAKFRDVPRNDEFARLKEEQERGYRDQIAKQITELQNLVTQVVARPAAPDSVLNDRLRQLEEERKTDRERYERERQEERHRQEIREMQSKTDQSLRDLQEKISARASGDPMIELLREMQRQTQSQMERLSSFMVTPTQIATMMRDTSSGSDDALRKVVDGFGAAFGTYRQALESIANLNSGGSVIPDMIKDGLDKASELARDVVGAKRDAAVSQAKAQQEASRAQIEAIRAASMPQQQFAAHAPVSAPAPAPVPPLNGVVEVPANGANAVPLTEEQLFGPTYPHIQRLRAMASAPFVDEKGATQPPLSPEQSAGSILQGIGYAQEHNLIGQIPAFQLLMEDRDAELITVIFPKMADFYREECLKHFREKLEAVTEPEGEDDDEEDTEESEDLPPEVAAIANTPAVKSPTVIRTKVPLKFAQPV